VNFEASNPYLWPYVRFRAWRRAAAAAVIITTALAIAGCGAGSHGPTTSTRTDKGVSTGLRYVNTANAQRLIEQQIDTQRHQRVVVLCPSNVPLEPGHQFICRAATPGRLNVLLVVTVLDDQGRLHFQPAGTS